MINNKSISSLILFLVLLNIPSILLQSFSIILSSPVSYLLFFLLFVLSVSNRFNVDLEIKIFSIISFLYFIIGAFNYNGSLIIMLIIMIKFYLLLYGLNATLSYVSEEKIVLLLFIGSFMILLDSIYFRFNDVVFDYHINPYYRYSGFYLNPNTAAFVSIVGYIFVLVKNYRFKLFLLLTFTLFGFMTLSRTFMMSWIIINIIYSIYNKKHLLYIPFFVLSIPLIAFFNNIFNLETNRMDFVVNFFKKGYIDLDIFNYNARQNTWGQYYDKIFDYPLFGSGFKSFSGGWEYFDQGVHNTFLLIIGESGLIPFILFTLFIIFIMYKTYKMIKSNLLSILLMLALLMQLLVSHNFFDSSLMIFILVFVINKINQLPVNNLNKDNI